MLIYLGIILISCLIAVFQPKPIPLILGIQFLVVFFCANYLVHTSNLADYDSYISATEIIAKTKDVVTFEPAFLVITKISLFLGLSYYFTYFVFTGLTLFFIFIASYRLSCNVYYSILIFVTHYLIIHGLVQIRAGVAIAMMLFGISFIGQSKIKYYLTLCVSLLFHASTLLFAIVPFLDRSTFSKAFYTSLLLIGFMVYALQINILESIVGLITPYFQNIYISKLATYATSQFSTRSSIGILLGVKLLFAFFLIHRINLFQDKNENSVLLAKIYIFGLFFFLLFSYDRSVSVRAFELFTIVEIFLVPTLVYICRPKLLGELIVLIWIGFNIWIDVPLFNNLL